MEMRNFNVNTEFSENNIQKTVGEIHINIVINIEYKYSAFNTTIFLQLHYGKHAALYE